ncbi:hypothetical protein AXG93_3310s1250 [Marchantia polymorpha subsp. ruderalis]|uniref:Uncharacterized protein n=1 Tax=Marchantia polymorpha subsp. ruderalis TaxID=1480154 RepID=A0A176W3G5_MARPO|nr:hypothetical protein AXG93_3310s1250 [Marchantia polymorpha subsp. ruderalis]
MPPKKKGKKKKKKPKEPKHDSGWKKVTTVIFILHFHALSSTVTSHQCLAPSLVQSGDAETIENGKWERPLESLPSIERWPTWGEIREKMFAALVKLTIIWSENLGDKFIDELFAVPRPRLSHSLEKLVLSRSMMLKKVLLETKTLKELVLKTCPVLETLMVWSDEMSHLNILDCKQLVTLELYCPKLEDLEKGPLKVDIPPPKPFPPILYILEQEDLRAPIPPPEFGYPNEVTGGYQGTKGDEKVGLSTTRPLIPRTHLFGV